MGKGGGGGSAPQAHSVPQLGTVMGSTQTLGGFSSQLLQPLMSMYNWAADIATGGNVNPAVASFPYSTILGAPPNAQGYNAFTGLNTPGGSIFGGTALGPGSNKTPYYQSAVFGMPGQDYFNGPGAMPNVSSGGGGAANISSGGGGAPATMATGQGVSGGWGGSGWGGSSTATTPVTIGQNPPIQMLEGPMITATSGPLSGKSVVPVYDMSSQQLGGYLGPNGNFIPVNSKSGLEGLAPATYQGSGGGGQPQPGSAGPAGMPTGQGPTSLLGPFLSQAWASIGDELNAARMIPGLMQQTSQFTQNAENTAAGFQSQGDQLYNMATTGTGLFPSQQAFVDQGVKAQKAALAQQLASEGLGSSTQLAQLQGEADQAGAATAGQLVQGNIGLAQQQYNLAQASQKIALGGQELSLGEQAAMTQELQGISSQSAGLQQQMWTQAMQGMGMVGQMVQTALSAFGYETQAANVQSNLNIANAQIAAQAQQAAQQSSGSGFSSMLGGLGSLLGGGGGGGSGGGLLGGLGGLFGGIGAGVGSVAGGTATGAITVVAAIA